MSSESLWTLLLFLLPLAVSHLVCFLPLRPDLWTGDLGLVIRVQIEIVVVRLRLVVVDLRWVWFGFEDY